MSLKFDLIQSWTVELAALEPLERIHYMRTIHDICMTRWLSGERLMPFGLLVILLMPPACFHSFSLKYKEQSC